MQQHPIHVVILTTEYPPWTLGGLGTYVAELAAGLARIDCRVTVISLKPGKAETVSQPNLTIHWFPTIGTQSEDTPGESGIVSNAHLTAQTQAVIERLNPPASIIHCHDWLGFPIAQQMASAFQVPLVATIHLLYGAAFRMWGERVSPKIIEIERDLCRQAAAIITVSHSMQELIEATYAVPRERMRVVHNGIDPQPFRPSSVPPEKIAELRQALSADGKKIILFAGRLTAQKGIDFLLESAAEVIARYAGVIYIIAGSRAGLDAGRLTRLYRNRFPQRQQLWSQLKFLGKVSRQHLAGLYQLADIALVPSIYEPFGYAATEAMAAGVPVIATSAGGLAEIVVDGETGLLVPVHPSDIGSYRVDVDKLTEAQLFLLNNDQIARRMGEAGVEWVLSRFNLEQMAQSVREVYADVLSRATTH